MNAKNAEEYLPFVQALAEGKTIQNYNGHTWVVMDDVVFGGHPSTYRVKPAPRRYWILKVSEHEHYVMFSEEGARLSKRELERSRKCICELISVVEVMT